MAEQYIRSGPPLSLSSGRHVYPSASSEPTQRTANKLAFVISDTTQPLDKYTARMSRALSNERHVGSACYFGNKHFFGWAHFLRQTFDDDIKLFVIFLLPRITFCAEDNRHLIKTPVVIAFLSFLLTSIKFAGIETAQWYLAARRYDHYELQFKFFPHPSIVYRQDHTESHSALAGRAL
jgi:hypothetical protein